MLMFHAAWIPGGSAEEGRFVVWGELPRTKRARGGATESDRPRAHPFAASIADLTGALGQDVTEGLNAHWGTTYASLPSGADGPLPSTGALTADDESSELRSWRIPVLAFEAGDVLLLIELFKDSDSTPIADDLRFWSFARLFTLELLARQRFVPSVQHEDGTLTARWQPVLDTDPELERFEQLGEAMPGVAAAFSWDASGRTSSAESRLRDFIASAVDVVARRSMQAEPPEEPQGRAVEAWLGALCFEPEIVGLTKRQATALTTGYDTWARPADVAAQEASAFRVCLRLDPPLASLSGQDPAGGRDWSLSYLLQATDDPSLLVPAEAVWRQRSTAARLLGRRITNPQEFLLAGLGRAARIFPPLEPSLRTARPVGCELSTNEAFAFVREAALVLQASGFGVMIPGIESRVGVRVRLGTPRQSEKKSEGLARMGFNTVVDYDWEIALGDEVLSRQEFEALAALKQPLVEVRGRWVELRPDQVNAALALFSKQGRHGELELADAIKLALGADGEAGAAPIEVTTDGAFKELIEGIEGGGGREELHEPVGFVGQLRPYQSVGLSWLAGLRRYGLGACLADDMGLGKTIQLIALLLHARETSDDSDFPNGGEIVVPRDSVEDGGSPLTPTLPRKGGGGTRPTLLVCPTSVVGNWRHELARFAPSLRVLVHQGADRTREDFAGEALRHDVVLSSYALLHRDEAALKEVEWGNVVLDEAQNIKNASTHAAQVARQLHADWRVAMTGTPVENRLDELWSILHFLNPGYLGSAEEFRHKFANPIQKGRDAAATARLKSLVAPFVLRRLKTDRSIIQDLPEKNEAKVFTTLTREQGTLYEAVVQAGLRDVQESEGIQRRGLVLAMLAKLKQICDHPALFMKDGSALPGRSGKLERLTEMTEELVDAGDRALIFTQYASMGRLLQEHLATHLEREVLFLHGGTSAAARDRMVERFQNEEHGPPIFVLSIKAGGTGLNLTRANHVFHFDRWWNPAVENQATDRAFRIGQKRDVQVHKFVCAGTLEEALDELIEQKQALSEAIVGTSEAWITEMTNDELRALLALSPDAVAAD